jgi:hypothetical protein
MLGEKSKTDSESAKKTTFDTKNLKENRNISRPVLLARNYRIVCVNVQKSLNIFLHWIEYSFL